MHGGSQSPFCNGARQLTNALFFSLCESTNSDFPLSSEGPYVDYNLQDFHSVAQVFMLSTISERSLWNLALIERMLRKRIALFTIRIVLFTKIAIKYFVIFTHWKDRSSVSQHAFISVMNINYECGFWSLLYGIALYIRTFSYKFIYLIFPNISLTVYLMAAWGREN